MARSHSTGLGRSETAALVLVALGSLRTRPGLQVALARAATATPPNVPSDHSAPVVPHNLLSALIADAIPVVRHRTRLPLPAGAHHRAILQVPPAGPTNRAPRHSARSATMGSMREARQAGSQLARSASAKMEAEVAACVAASVGATPYNSEPSRRASASEAGAPRAIATSASRAPCATTIRCTLREPAPSAMRTPISCVRCVTE